jgi:hypothetical protein
VIGHQHSHCISLQLTDAEAEALIVKLATTLERRRRLMAVEPAMRNWSDHSHVVAGTVDDKGCTISFSIYDDKM